MADSVGPIDEIPGTEPVQPHGEGLRPGAAQRRPIVGVVLDVRAKTGHRDGPHLLDESVGAQPYTEITVRVETGPVDHLEGERVVIHVAPE